MPPECTTTDPESCKSNKLPLLPLLLPPSPLLLLLLRPRLQLRRLLLLRRRQLKLLLKLPPTPPSLAVSGKHKINLPIPWRRSANKK